MDDAVEISQISIVGGGIGGLTAALALQHFGYQVSVFEQADELREIGAGVTITPNAMHALNFLGVGKRVAQEAGPPDADSATDRPSSARDAPPDSQRDTASPSGLRYGDGSKRKSGNAGNGSDSAADAIGFAARSATRRNTASPTHGLRPRGTNPDGNGNAPGFA